MPVPVVLRQRIFVHRQDILDTPADIEIVETRGPFLRLVTMEAVRW